MLKHNTKEEIYEEDYDEIDLMELFFELLNHWKMIAISTILMGIIAFAISKFLITPQYESTSELYVLSKSTSITSLSDIQLGSSLTNDYIVVVNGRPVLDQVIENLSLSESYEALVGKVTLTNPSNSRILQITVQDPDSNRAKAIADEIASVASAFIAEKMDQDPPTIIQYGYADGAKVSPSVGKNTVLGAIIGAFLAIAVIVVIYLINDTIIDSEDVERKLGMNLLATLPLEETEGSTDTKAKKKKAKKKKR